MYFVKKILMNSFLIAENRNPSAIDGVGENKGEIASECAQGFRSDGNTLKLPVVTAAEL